MPTSPEQDREIDRIITDSPEDSCRIRPNVGPDHDRAVLSFPSGRQVVLDPDGEILGDSGRGGEIVDALADRARRSDPPPPAGYDPACDLLIVERPDGEHCAIPPWRCAMAPWDHMSTPLPLGDLMTLRQWAENILHRSLKVWVLARGETEIKPGESE